MAEEKVFDAGLQQKLTDYIKTVGNQKKVAAQLGYSDGVLSAYRSGKYTGDVEGFEAKLQEFFGVREEAELYRPIHPDYLPTSISEQVYHTIRICHLKGGLAIECGDAGIGKTKAAQKYAQDYPSSAIYVSVNPCLVSTTAFFKLLCKRLRIPTGRKDDMWLEIDEHLRGGKKVLIIDEAQHLPIKTIESVRALFDSNPEMGIIFVGNMETVTNCGKPGKASFSQINNRRKLTEVRHTAQVTLEDIKLLCPTLGKQELEFLHVVAQTEQGVRGAMNLYSNALDNENLTYAGLVAMAKAMKIIMS